MINPLADSFMIATRTHHSASSEAVYPANLRDRIAALVGDMDVDLDAEIDGDVALQP